MKARDIIRPKKIKQKIFGEEHDLRRLSMGDVLDLISDVDFNKIKDRDPVVILAGCSSAVDKILRASFPTFKEWEEFPQSEVPYLLEIIFDANELKDLIGNFTELVGNMKKALPVNVMNSLA